MLPRRVLHVRQQRTAETASLMPGRDADVEQMRLVEDQHEHAITNYAAILFEYPAAVARRQRIAEIAARPRIWIDDGLDCHDGVEIGRLHGPEIETGVEQRVQPNFIPAARSLVSSATLLRI